VACVDGTVQQLSYDHKPNNDSETKRIVAAGGWVEFNRVNGNLALSRALGDFIFKKNDRKSAEEQIVTAYPDVIMRDLTASHEFIIMACDGIWDVMSNQEVVQFVRARIAQRAEPSVICEDLLNTCLAPDAQMGGLGCDNMTVILICILQGGTYEQLASRCSKPAKNHTTASISQLNTMSSLGSQASSGHPTSAHNSTGLSQSHRTGPNFSSVPQYGTTRVNHTNITQTRTAAAAANNSQTRLGAHTSGTGSAGRPSQPHTGTSTYRSSYHGPSAPYR